MQEILTAIPDGWGKKLEFGGGAIAHACIEPQSFRMVANVHYFLTFFTAQPDRELALNSDSVIRGFAPVGSLEIFPAQSDLLAGLSIKRLFSSG